MAFWVYEQKMGVDDWITTRAPVVTKKNSKALQHVGYQKMKMRNPRDP